MSSYFHVPSMVITFRESTEVAVIISSLFLLTKNLFDGNRSLMRKIKLSIWAGTALGVLITVCLAVAAILIVSEVNAGFWTDTEDIWEGVLALMAAAFMTIFAFGIIRVSKGGNTINSKFSRTLGMVSQGKKSKINYYPLITLPMISVAREGVETIVFLSGLSGTAELGWKSLVMPAIVGVALGACFGVLLHSFAKKIDRIKVMFGLSVLLIIMSSALVSKAVWNFEHSKWSKYLPPDGDEGPSIQYDLMRVNWVLNCCDPRVKDSIWSFLQVFLGWNNVSYPSTAASYFFYWVLVVLGIFWIKRHDELLVPEKKKNDNELLIGEN